MSFCTVREWEYVPINESGAVNTLRRRAADSLVATARSSRLGGSDGEGIVLNGHLRLRAQQVVGVLASQNAVLEILPKIDNLESDQIRGRLIHMLARVYDLHISSGLIAELGWQKHDLLEILIRLFCDRLFEAVHRGLPRRYIGSEADLSVLRGRLNAQRQFTVLAASPQTVASRFDELSQNIALNQIMKAAISCLIKRSRVPQNQRRLRELSLAFEDISAVPIKELRWNEVVLDRTNDSWGALLSLAKLLLGERFQTTSSGDAGGYALLFEMNTLFEEYVGRTLRRALRNTGLNVCLQGPLSHALVAQDGVHRFRTRPDIVITRDGVPVLIVDTKWKRLKGEIDDPKRGVSQGDIYQMMAYSQVYDCPQLMLLYPHNGNLGSVDGILETHRIQGTSDARLSVASVSLRDISSVGERLRSLVADRLAQSGAVLNNAA